MKNKHENPHHKAEDTIKESPDLTGYPLYPPSEDIYNNAQKEENINLDNLGQVPVTPIDKESIQNEVNRDSNGGDLLDIPGSELDDQLEIIGSEDEENNYYSIGGDQHLNLEEDHGEDVREIPRDDVD